MIVQWLLVVPFSFLMGLALYLAVTPVNPKSSEVRQASSTVQVQAPNADAPERDRA